MHKIPDNSTFSLALNVDLATATLRPWGPARCPFQGSPPLTWCQLLTWPHLWGDSFLLLRVGSIYLSSIYLSFVSAEHRTSREHLGLIFRVVESVYPKAGERPRTVTVSTVPHAVS